MHWFVDVLKNKYILFTGRSHREEFWMFQLFYFLIYFGCLALDSLVGTMGIILGLFWLGTLMPSLGVWIRRMHDTGKSGWWLAIGFVPVVGAIVLIIFAALPTNPAGDKYGPAQA